MLTCTYLANQNKLKGHTWKKIVLDDEFGLEEDRLEYDIPADKNTVEKGIVEYIDNLCIPQEYWYGELIEAKACEQILAGEVTLALTIVKKKIP